MTEVKKLVNSNQTVENSKKYPKVVVGAFVFNEKEELLLIKAPRWQNKYTCIGGKVELNETLVNTLKREVEEEVNLQITGEAKLISITDGLELEEHNTDLIKHLIFIDYIIKVKPGEIILSDEASEYKWLTVDEWLKQDKKILAPYVLSVLEKIKKQEEIGNLENKYKRALADYQNLLKQTVKEKMEFARFANEQLLYQLLPVYDHLKIALENQSEENHNSWMEGVKHVVKQFKNVLNEIGVEEIKTVGEKFDHNFMEAISEDTTYEEKQDGMVAKELRAGYKLNGKVIIPAKVVVYKIKN